MKKYQYSDSAKKLNRKRLAAFAVMILWLLLMAPFSNESDWFFRATAQLIPLLTFEKQYGNPAVDYAAGYEVPDWFYEDENEEPVNGDTAMAQPQQEVVESDLVTTLADGTNGTTYTREQLGKKDFLLSKIFVVDGNTSMTAEELDIKNLLDTDLSIDGLKDTAGESGYKILIYHTHGSESFVDSREGVKEDTIVGVGSYLADLLREEYGISVYHDETAYDMIDGVLDRSRAYENAYNSVSKILQENPSIQVVIDLHRDGVDEETHLVTDVNGKKTAKIMFLNGVSRSNMNGEIEYLKNPNKLANLSFSFQMYLTGKEYYGDYVRKVYVRSLRYNLHLMPRAALIEVGAQNNTVQEEKNAMEPLAAIIDKVLSKKE